MGLRARAALLSGLFLGCDYAAMDSNQGQAPSDGGVELLANGSFDQGISTPWMEYFGAPASGSSGLEEGRLCLTVDSKGINEWDAQLRARGISLLRGHRIAVKLEVSASPGATVALKLALQAAPYTQYWQERLEATKAATVLSRAFLMSAASDENAELAVMVGGSLAKTTPVELCIDNVSVRDLDQAPGALPGAELPPRVVHLNQLGFRPGSDKLAVWQTSSPEVTPFSVIGPDGSVVFQGESAPRGVDLASGDSVQWLDFSALSTPCEACRVTVAGQESARFRVAEDALDALAKHALAYFYHNRSGTPITLPYVGDAQWVRAAGHLGDADVGCFAASPCDYRLDASGGWYDAGDQRAGPVEQRDSARWRLTAVASRDRIPGSRSRLSTC